MNVGSDPFRDRFALGAVFALNGIRIRAGASAPKCGCRLVDESTESEDLSSEVPRQPFNRRVRALPDEELVDRVAMSVFAERDRVPRLVPDNCGRSHRGVAIVGSAPICFLRDLGFNASGRHAKPAEAGLRQVRVASNCSDARDGGSAAWPGLRWDP